MALPKVSVVMSTYNESINELKDSIYSILNQIYSNFDLIIVDDNPEYKKLKKYLLYISKKHKNVTLLLNKRNLGAALSRDKGIRHADGKYIAIMDADDVSVKCRLSIELKFLMKYNLDFVFPNYKLFSNYNITNEIYTMNSITNQFQLYKIFSKINDISINSGWLVKKKIFKKLNGYRDIIDEDYDFIARAIISNYSLGYIHDVLIYKRYRKNSVMRKNSLKIYLTSRYIKYFLKKRKIFYMNDFDKFIANNFDERRALRFNKFVVECHNVRYKLSIKNLLKLFYMLCSTNFAVKYVIDKLSISLKNKKLSKE